MSFWENFWDIIWWIFLASAFFAYLYTLFAVITDLFRDHQLNGWWKVVWLIFLCFLPFLTVLVYVVARGRGMTERAMERNRAYQESTNAYIRDVASGSPSEEIAKAKDLLDSGTISAEEFEKIKSKAVA